ncbi:MAG: DUF2281 domain-containing protein [Blastocatellia bacterium]
MTEQEILREIGALPPEGQRLVESFVAFLRLRYEQSATPSVRPPLEEEAFIGMWRDRDDLTDSTAWVRSLRETEWRQ